MPMRPALSASVMAFALFVDVAVSETAPDAVTSEFWLMNAVVLECVSARTWTKVAAMPPIAVTRVLAFDVIVEVALPVTDDADRLVSPPMYVLVLPFAYAVG